MRFTNLNNTRIVVQKDGNMVGNKVISDGKGGFVNSTDPNDTVSLQAFGNIFLQDVKEFDSNAALDKVVNKLGDYEYVFKELSTYTKAGTLFKVKDITAMDSDAYVSKEIKEAGNAFLEAEEAALSQIMADPFQAVSVLMDGVGGFTNCKPGEDCKGSKNIKQEYTEGGLLMPSLTEEQIDMGKDFLRSQFRAKLDRTVAATSTGRVTRPSYVKPTPIPKSAELWNSIYSATPEQQDMYMKQLASTDRMVKLGYKGGKFVELTDPVSKLKYKALEVYYDNASGKGKTKTGKNAIPLQIIKKDKDDKYYVTNPTSTEWNQMGEDFNGGANIRPAKGEYVPTEIGIEAFSDDPVRDAKDYIRAMKTKIVDEEGKFNSDEGGFTEDFNRYYENLGFKADWTYFDGNKVKVTNTEDKDQPTITINPENEKELNDLINFMNTGLLDVVAENFMSSLTEGAATTEGGKGAGDDVFEEEEEI
ncbi:MAG TPA: hypothetical protein DCX27_03505 [Balneola sp.]|nr:hypothetical protein [Balneola sp.]